MAPFATQPPQEPALQQFGVEPVGFRPAMFPRYRDTRGMDHMRLHPMRTKPARQPEAIAAGFESQRNPRDLAAGLDRLVAPAMQQAKQPDMAAVAALPARTQEELLDAIAHGIYHQPPTDWSTVTNLGMMRAVPEVRGTVNLALIPKIKREGPRVRIPLPPAESGEMVWAGDEEMAPSSL